MAQQGGGGGQNQGGDKKVKQLIIRSDEIGVIKTFAATKPDKGNQKGTVPPLSICTERNGTEYLKLTKYLYNDDGKNTDGSDNKEKSTPKTVFLLLYKSEIPDQEDVAELNSETLKAIQNAQATEPIMSRLFDKPTNKSAKSKNPQIDELEKKYCPQVI